MNRIISHVKCRNADYPGKGTKIVRFPVPDDKISWDLKWAEYAPVIYTSPHLKGQSWADKELDWPDFKPNWNSIDGNINRCSYHGEYQVINNVPINPVGRTGLAGRGILGRWGPNHAADPIVTKWKRDTNKSLIHNSSSGKPILQFIGIKRRDCGEWAIPGGMVDPGEVISLTLKREFMEEALNSLEMTVEEKNRTTNHLNDFFNQGVDIYKGYVDDVRNTDNAWIETLTKNFHDDSGHLLDKLQLKAGDDAGDVSWIDISACLRLYASHSYFIKLVAEKLNSHW